MKRMLLIVGLVLAATPAPAATVCERWGGRGKGLAHPGTLKVERARRGTPAAITVDLSALPKGAKVHHASLICFTQRGRQPERPVRILDGGRALPLEPPRYHSFDAAAAVRRAVRAGRPLTLAVERFDGWDRGRTILEIRYEGTLPHSPAQVTGLRAVHHHGQTFLLWRELPLFRPDPEKVFWMTEHKYVQSERSDKPGKGWRGYPAVPAVTLKTLRDLKGLSVRGKKGPREMQPIRVLKKLPHIRYRVYRHTERITPKNIHQATYLGESRPCNAYVEEMLTVVTHGEYYDPYEHPESVIMTWCYDDSKPVMPGEAFYVHTPRKAAKAYYAVTVMQDGRENLVDLGNGNSLAKPVAETPATPRPVFQFAKKPGRYIYRPGKYEPASLWHALWLAPPIANLPSNHPRYVVVGEPPDFQEPGPMKVSNSSPGMFFEGPLKNLMRAPDTLVVFMAGGGELAYSSGKGTLRSYKECPADYFAERYTLAVIQWAMSKWKIDPSRITAGTSTHFAIRHPELFGIKHIGPFSMNFDNKWNPHSGSMARLLGPPDTARTVDGHRAWDIFNIRWYLAQDPGRDIPYMACFFTQPKDGNHGAEYGWQDDPKGLSALQQSRQPHCAQWGGARVSSELSKLLGGMRWDRSLPGFSRCSLDQNPGNGDPDDGDPWGQINGWLLWDYGSVVDKADEWSAVVYLAPSAPFDRCTVDITPRRCEAFKPKPGAKFAWTNTADAEQKAAPSGEVEADRWGRVTLRDVTVTKGKHRMEISRKR
jgi:hypothetical protein